MNNMDKMLEQASKRLGTNPESLRGALEKGKMNEIISNLSQQDKERLIAVLSNKELREKLMNSKQAADLMKNMNEK